jgi:polyhydroxybutyrate depolymerase
MQRIMLLLLLIAGLSFGAKAQTSTQNSFEYDGLERSYSLFVPETLVSRLLIILHPFGSSGLGMQYITGMNAYAAEMGFAVAYPNAATYYWDEGRSRFNVGPEDIAVDDLGFIGTLADRLSSELAIDSTEVYLAGMGSGGALAYLAACTNPRQFKSVAVVATMLWDYQALSCPETQSAPLNLLLIWGDYDPLYLPVDYPQRISNRDSVIYGTVHTTEFWLERNRCARADKTRPIHNVDIYPCANETSFAFVTVQNSGNIWPRKGDYQLNRYDLDASEIIAKYITGDPEWYTAAQQTDKSQETPRSWTLYVPSSYDPSVPSPLVLLLHGRGGSAASQAYISDFKTVAEREGLIAVFPDGLNHEWNYVRNMPSYEGIGPQDDDAFLNGLIDDLSLELNIDQQRVYVTGYSNGGFMAQRLACTQQERYAAIASVAATGSYGLPELCEGRDHKPVMYIHGTEDEIVPWDGQLSQAADGSSFYISAPMSRTIGFWANHNECGDELDQRDLEQTSELSQTRVLRVTGCPNDGLVIIYMVSGGGHVWPGIRETEAFLGYSSEDFNASDVIWNFFDQFELEN